jgi:hypothetical protein
VTPHMWRLGAAILVAMLPVAVSAHAQVAARSVADPAKLDFRDFEDKFSRALRNSGLDYGASGIAPADRNTLSAAIQSIALSGSNMLIVDALVFSVDLKGGGVTTVGRFRSQCNPALFADEVAAKLDAKRTAQGNFSALDAVHLIPEWICTQPAYAARTLVVGADGQASVQ